MHTRLSTNAAGKCACVMHSCDLQRSELQKLPGTGISEEGLQTDVSCTGAATRRLNEGVRGIIISCACLYSGVRCFIQTSTSSCLRSEVAWGAVQSCMGSLSAATVDRRYPRLAFFTMPTPFWGSGGRPDSPGPCYLTLSCDVPTLPSLPNLHLLYAASKLCPEVLLHREMGQPGKNAPTAHHPSLGCPPNYTDFFQLSSWCILSPSSLCADTTFPGHIP